MRFYKNCPVDGDNLIREDYMQFLNTEFHKEDEFSRIESRLQAIETLVACTKQFPNYDLNKDTKEMLTRNTWFTRTLLSLV